MTHDGLLWADPITNKIAPNPEATASLFMQYISALYFSVVTCTTTGYGDIVPLNNYELMWVVGIMLIGVSVFSFVLGDMASQFSDITLSNKQNEERNR